MRSALRILRLGRRRATGWLPGSPRVHRVFRIALALSVVATGVLILWLKPFDGPAAHVAPSPELLNARRPTLSATPNQTAAAPELEVTRAERVADLMVAEVPGAAWDQAPSGERRRQHEPRADQGEDGEHQEQRFSKFLHFGLLVALSRGHFPPTEQEHPSQGEGSTQEHHNLHKCSADNPPMDAATCTDRIDR